MIYRKNMSFREQGVRSIAGIAMIACGLWGLPGLALGYLVAGAGAITLLTGFVGYCPACAAIGRKAG